MPLQLPYIRFRLFLVRSDVSLLGLRVTVVSRDSVEVAITIRVSLVCSLRLLSGLFATRLGKLPLDRDLNVVSGKEVIGLVFALVRCFTFV